MIKNTLEGFIDKNKHGKKEYTDTLPRKAHRPFCHICNEVIRVDISVTDDVWELSLHQGHRNGYVCVACFTRNADERGVDWGNSITFIPLPQTKGDKEQ